MSLGPPDKTYTTTRSCYAGTSGAFTYRIGQPVAGQTIENGKQGVAVECLVRADGSFNATISGADENGHKPASFSFTGKIADKNQTASNIGQMTSISPDTGPMANLTGGPNCTFGPVVTLKKGALLTDVDCPLIGVSDDISSGCSVHGTIAFEYCKTGDEQN